MRTNAFGLSIFALITITGCMVESKDDKPKAKNITPGVYSAILMAVRTTTWEDRKEYDTLEYKNEIVIGENREFSDKAIMRGCETQIIEGAYRILEDSIFL